MSLQDCLDSLENALQSAPKSMRERAAVYNRLVDMAARYLDLPHPAARPQLIPVEKVKGNDYNPNKVAPPEMRLLRLSMAKDGQTMPVVVSEHSPGSFQIVDGFHRRSIAKNTPEIREALQGYLFVVELNKSLEDRITSTVRHNMARGSHKVELTAKLVTTLKKNNWTNERIGMELGMDPDEVLRLKQVTGLAEAFEDKEFSRAWE